MIKAILLIFASCLSIYPILMLQFPSKPAYVGAMSRQIERNAVDIVRLEEATIKAKRNLDEIRRTQTNLTKTVNNLRKTKKVKRK